MLQHWYGYNSVCLFKPTTPSRLQGRLNLAKVNCCLKNTSHFTQTKGKSLDQSEALLLKECKRGFIVHSKHLTCKIKRMRSPYLWLFCVTFYSNKFKDKQEKQVTHTYNLIEAKIFKEATKGNKEKIDSVR